MKKIIIIISISLSCLYANSQSLSTDSLSIIIRSLQKQVATLQTQVSDLSKVHTITFDPASFSVQSKDSLNQSVFLKNTTVDLSSINSQISNLQNKIAALKATSITTTTIQ